MEKKITQLFDELTPEEAALAGDECRIEHGDKDISARILSLTKRKAGITMKETTNAKAKKYFKRSTIIAIAAAAVLTCTAAAAGITAIHERSVNKYFGEGAAAELSKKGIMINKVETNDDYKLTVDLAYATDDYARVMFTFEGLNDAAKERIANTTNWYWDIEPHFIDDSRPGFGCGGGALGGIDDEEIDRDKEKGIYTFDVTMEADLSNIESYTLSMIPQEWSETSGVANPDGELNVITVDFEITPNITPISFESSGHPGITLCDFDIVMPNAWDIIPHYTFIPEEVGYYPDEGEPTKEEHNAEYEAHKNDPCLTFVYKDGSKQVLTSDMIEINDHVYFMGVTVDSENVEKIIVGDGKIEYTRK